MGLSFTDALKSFSAAEVALIEATLMHWIDSDGLARDLVRNVKDLESFLPGENMAELLQAICSCHGKPIDELRGEYRSACYRNVKKGGAVRAPQPVLLGRAVEKESFVVALYEMHGPIGSGSGYFPSLDAVRDFVLRLLSGDKLSSRECDLLMSKYAVWVTWDRSDSSSDPFSFSASATEIRACLGLDSLIKRKGEPLLLLVYEKSAKVELLRATVADAVLYKYYEPPPIGFDAYGLTKPWSEDFTPGFRPYSLPEAIHGSESFDVLVIPIKEVL
jgi:hypothetical protein